VSRFWPDATALILPARVHRIMAYMSTQGGDLPPGMYMMR
jgi:hypothetical protein